MLRCETICSRTGVRRVEHSGVGRMIRASDGGAARSDSDSQEQDKQGAAQGLHWRQSSIWSWPGVVGLASFHCK